MNGGQPPRRAVALDACVLINLVASGLEVGTIGAATHLNFCVTEIVSRETHSLLPSESHHDRAEIDVIRLVQTGQLRAIPFQGDELSHFVSLAAELDDGEASVIAVAASRSWTVATDDRRAARSVRRLGLELIGTTDVMQAWESGGGVTADEVSRALQSIEVRARFKPRADDPRREWWDKRLTPGPPTDP